MEARNGPTRSFKELVQKRIAIGEALLHEGNTMLAGDVDIGKVILRDYIKATVGFETLGEATVTQPKGLIRMFGPRGNPQARNLQKQAGATDTFEAGVPRMHFARNGPLLRRDRPANVIRAGALIVAGNRWPEPSDVATRGFYVFHPSRCCFDPGANRS